MAGAHAWLRVVAFGGVGYRAAVWDASPHANPPSLNIPRMTSPTGSVALPEPLLLVAHHHPLKRAPTALRRHSPLQLILLPTAREPGRGVWTGRERCFARARQKKHPALNSDGRHVIAAGCRRPLLDRGARDWLSDTPLVAQPWFAAGSAGIGGPSTPSSQLGCAEK